MPGLLGHGHPSQLRVPRNRVRFRGDHLDPVQGFDFYENGERNPPISEACEKNVDETVLRTNDEERLRLV